MLIRAIARLKEEGHRVAIEDKKVKVKIELPLTPKNLERLGDKASSWKIKKGKMIRVISTTLINLPSDVFNELNIQNVPPSYTALYALVRKGLKLYIRNTSFIISVDGKKFKTSINNIKNII